MTKTLRNRLTLLGTASLFAVALVAAPVQLNFGNLTLDKTVAEAAAHGGGGWGGRLPAWANRGIRHAPLHSYSTAPARPCAAG